MHYFEDFRVGDTFDLGILKVTEEDIITFARQFDPQPFHIDPERAKDSIFGGLVASGWHITSLFMRLFYDGLLHETASMGSPGVDEVRWLKPVRPGDILQGHFIVLESRPSSSRPDLGIIRSRSELLNQAAEVVMSLKGVHFVGRRMSGDA
jgi:acyl dehydratase